MQRSPKNGHSLPTKKKGEQLLALSDHLEKMMALLRAEAAAKASSQEAVIELENELASEKAKNAGLLSKIAVEEAERKRDLDGGKMLSNS